MSTTKSLSGSLLNAMDLSIGQNPYAGPIPAARKVLIVCPVSLITVGFSFPCKSLDNASHEHRIGSPNFTNGSEKIASALQLATATKSISRHSFTSMSSV